MSEKRWWEVRTGAPNDESRSDSVLLGRFFGYVDDIALRLAELFRTMIALSVSVNA